MCFYFSILSRLALIAEKLTRKYAHTRKLKWTECCHSGSISYIIACFNPIYFYYQYIF